MYRDRVTLGEEDRRNFAKLDGAPIDVTDSK